MLKEVVYKPPVPYSEEFTKVENKFDFFPVVVYDPTNQTGRQRYALLVKATDNPTIANNYRVKYQRFTLDIAPTTTTYDFSFSQRFTILEFYVFGVSNPSTLSNTFEIYFDDVLVGYAAHTAPTPIGWTTDLIGYFFGTQLTANAKITVIVTSGGVASGYYDLYIKGFVID